MWCPFGTSLTLTYRGPCFPCFNLRIPTSVQNIASYPKKSGTFLLLLGEFHGVHAARHRSRTQFLAQYLKEQEYVLQPRFFK